MQSGHTFLIVPFPLVLWHELLARSMNTRPAFRHGARGMLHGPGPAAKARGHVARPRSGDNVLGGSGSDFKCQSPWKDDQLQTLKDCNIWVALDTTT